jgi:DNA-binding protein HU-beta
MAKAASGGKSMTKSEIAATLAETAGLSKKQVANFSRRRPNLAYKQAKNTFRHPRHRQARPRRKPGSRNDDALRPQGRPDRQGPKRKKVKFRIAKAAKDAILGAKK